MMKYVTTQLITSEWLNHTNVLLWFDTGSTIPSLLDL